MLKKINKPVERELYK